MIIVGNLPVFSQRTNEALALRSFSLPPHVGIGPTKERTTTDVDPPAVFDGGFMEAGDGLPSVVRLSGRIGNEAGVCLTRENGCRFKEKSNGVAMRNKPNFMVSRSDFLLKTTLEDQVLFRAALRRAREKTASSTHMAVFFDRISCTENSFCFCEGSLRLMSEENAGGSSEVSEAFSMEILARRFGAFNTISEMEIKYWSPHWKKIDYICSLSEEQRVGVSVTRLMGFPVFDQVTRADCIRLLKKKLYGLIVAKSGVDPSHHYASSILHVFCASLQVAEMLALVICQANMLFSRRNGGEEDASSMTGQEVEELEELAFLYEEDVGGSFADDLIIHITIASETPCIFNNDMRTVAFEASA